MAAHRSPSHGATTTISSSSSSPSWSLSSLHERATTYSLALYDRYRALSPGRRFYLHCLIVFEIIILAIVFYIGPDAIFSYTARLALWIANRPYGLPLIIGLVTLLSFPPLFGYGTAITLCGLGWGVDAPATKDHPSMHGSLMKGWAVASSACLVGASVAFVVMRHLIRRNAHIHYVHRILDDPKFRAMKEAVRRKGSTMVILIRFCPFPFCYSNLFFASLDTVSFLQFFLATLLITPKLLLHVFIGARMFELMDSEQRAKLDGWHKVLNVVYIAIGTVVGILTGWLVWKETQKILDTTPSSASLPSSSDFGRFGRGTTRAGSRGREFVVEFDRDLERERELRRSLSPYDDDDEEEDEGEIGREYVEMDTPVSGEEERGPFLLSSSANGAGAGVGARPGEGKGTGRGTKVQPFKLIDDDDDDEEEEDGIDRRDNGQKR